MIPMPPSFAGPDWWKIALLLAFAPPQRYNRRILEEEFFHG